LIRMVGTSKTGETGFGARSLSCHVHSRPPWQFVT
jgi:hypothetical protein